MPKSRSRGPVVIDSSAWIEFLGAAGTPIAEETRRLLGAGRARLTGVALAELLQGAVNEKEREELAEALRGVEYAPAERATHETAGMMGARLRARGITVPVSDLIIAAVALERGWPVLTTDPHFSKVPGLVLKTPK